MVLWRRRRRVPYAAVSDEERMSRYVYLLNTLPASVIERAHESAFRKMPPSRRREMFEKLRPFMSEQEQARQPEPTLLASVLSRVSPAGGGTPAAVLEDDRRPDRRDSNTANVWPFNDPLLATIVASNFLSSSIIVSYFTVGAGSVGMVAEPAWVGDIRGVQSDSYYSGEYNSDSGGGYDGGGGFGGFDGGGFGGGGFGGGGDGGGMG